jgi:hypothetical protein
MTKPKLTTPQAKSQHPSQAHRIPIELASTVRQAEPQTHLETLLKILPKPDTHDHPLLCSQSDASTHDPH